MKDLKKLTAPLEVAHKCPLRRTLNRIFQLIGDFAVPESPHDLCLLQITTNLRHSSIFGGLLHSFLLILPPKPQEHGEHGEKHEDSDAAKYREENLGWSILLVRSLYVTPLNVRQWTAHHSGNAWSRGLTSELHRSGAMNWCQSERCDIDGL